MLCWIYNTTVYPGWEVDGEAIMRVDTSQSSVAAVPEILVNLLIPESDSYLTVWDILRLTNHLSNSWREIPEL